MYHISPIINTYKDMLTKHNMNFHNTQTLSSHYDLHSMDTHTGISCIKTPAWLHTALSKTLTTTRKAGRNI
uniref:Uncharacterized protein n=1 Tax=Arion vulgaris TaxID=1028688 RepID=A0A0B6XYK0_9EUPU